MITEVSDKNVHMYVYLCVYITCTHIHIQTHTNQTKVFLMQMDRLTVTCFIIKAKIIKRNLY